MLGQERPPVPRTTATNARFSYHADSFDSVSSSSGAKTTSTTTARKRLTQHSFPSSGTQHHQQQQQTYSKPQKQPAGGDHTRHRSSSVASTATASKLLPSPEAVLAKEKEFMANTRILAMSSLIDSFASSSHSKQGFYGKQLKIIGTVNPWSSSSSTTTTSSTGSELDVTVKVLRMMSWSLISNARKTTTRHRHSWLGVECPRLTMCALSMLESCYRFTLSITHGRLAHCYRHQPSFTAGTSPT